MTSGGVHENHSSFFITRLVSVWISLFRDWSLHDVGNFLLMKTILEGGVHDRNYTDHLWNNHYRGFYRDDCSNSNMGSEGESMTFLCSEWATITFFFGFLLGMAIVGICMLMDNQK